MVARALVPSDTVLFSQTSFQVYFKYPNDTTIVTYRNGTIAQFNDSGFVSYITPPAAYLYVFADNSFELQSLDGTQIYFVNFALTA